ncbi:MAG: hypothetical protein ACI8WB_000525 [Phenylobacterium sp.]|jgi:hypothetical protein
MLSFAIPNIWSGLAAISFLASIVAVFRYIYKSFSIYKNGQASLLYKWSVYLYAPLVIVSMGSIMVYYAN